MSTLNKTGTTLALTIGIISISLATYAFIDPTGVENFMSSAFVGTWGPYVVGAIFVLTVIPAVFLIFGMAGNAIKNGGIKKRLREYGTKSTATIINIEDTGVTVNVSPLVRVTVETQQHVKGTFDMYVSRVGFPSPGDQIEIVYNPNDPAEIMAASMLQ